MTLPRPLEKLIPSYGRWPLLLALAFQFLCYFGTKLVAVSWPHHVMETALDRAIPLVPWTVAVYCGAFLFWAVNYILAVRQGQANAMRFLAADTAGKLVCFVVFLALPTTVTRPEVPAGGFFSWVMALVYAADTPVNLFPSLHCFCSWLCWAGIRGQRDVPRGYRVFSLIMTLAVGVSTLTTKQHVIVDVVAGFALAELCWQAAGHTKLSAWYGAAVRRLSREKVSN